ncbi:MAG: N-acetylmuramoyl-L-alanine amidase [Chloroflexi bacterium]|nr:N-acetylmuramoyl-L-alanine amidase [Chloroflexota bacterium]
MKVKWIGSPHCSAGRPHGPPIALVIHTMSGSLAGCDSHFNNTSLPPDKRVSAHYGISLSGEVHQYVRLEDQAWANGILEAENIWPGPAGINPNALSVSIETEDQHNPAEKVTAEQYEATLAIGRLVLHQYPHLHYLMTHRAITPKNRPNCPGARWVESGHFGKLATALGLEPVV